MHPMFVEEMARQKILAFHRETEAHRLATLSRTGRRAPVARALLLAGRFRRLVTRRPATI